MIISEALAQGTSGGGSGFLIQIAPLVLIFAVFYFLLIRPQQKKMKEHKAMVAAISKGDKVVTAGGLLGTIVKVEDDRIASVEIAENVKVKIVRATITEVISENSNNKK
jgi:preprotein translocase subunit YajC